MPQNDTKITLSRTAIEALPLPPVGKRAYFRDAKEPGLIVIITPTGTRTFQLYVKHDGRPVRVTLGRFSPRLAESAELPRDCSHTEFLANNPDLNIRMARHLAGLVKMDLKAGTNPTEVKKVKRGELTLGELFEVYVDRYLVVNGRKGVQSIREDFERLLGALPATERKKQGRQRQKSPGSVNWQNRRLSSITKLDILALRDSLAKESSSDNANRAVKILRSMFNRANEFELFKKDNPADGVAMFKAQSRERFLQTDEMPRFFQSIAMEPSGDVRDFFLVSLLTGVRKSNVLGMRWQDVNLDRATWTIPGEFTKNGDLLTLPLAPEVITILRARKPQDAAEFVFPGDGKSGHIEDPRKGWVRVLDRDELLQLAERITAAGGDFHVNTEDPAAPHFDFLAVALKKARKLAAEMKLDVNGTRLLNLRAHDLRRTLGSWQAAAGASLLVIQKSLGHRSDAATKIYAHLNLDPVRGSVNTATKAMLVAGGLAPEAEVKPITKAKKSPRKVGQ